MSKSLPTKMNTTDVLRLAKEEIIDPAHWWQGGFVCNQTGRICILGAIGVVVFGRDTFTSDPNKNEVLEAHPAVQALNAVIEVEDDSDYLTAVDRIPGFNDDAHHATVIDAFDRAILSLTRTVLA